MGSIIDKSIKAVKEIFGHCFPSDSEECNDRLVLRDPTGTAVTFGQNKWNSWIPEEGIMVIHVTWINKKTTMVTTMPRALTYLLDMHLALKALTP